MAERIINVPNAITSIGILSVIVYIFGYLSGNIYLTLAMLLLAGASDVLDGWLARLLNQETLVGRLLDKLRDTMLFLAIAGNLMWINTPGTIFLLKVIIAAEIIWVAITIVAPSADRRSNHLFNKLRQSAYFLLIVFVILS